jgi:hypothetical protein
LDKRLNPDLLGCPMYRKLMPRKLDIWIVEIFYPLFIMAMDLGAIWAIESREIHDSIDTAKNIGYYFIVFVFTMMIMCLWVHSSNHAKTEYRKRAERLERIPEADFWELEAEVSVSEKLYGSFYLLKDYLYAPEKRLLISYKDIDTWKYADFFTVISGDLKDAFLDVVEKDGFKTQIIIRDRKKLIQERDALRLKLNFKIRKANYPNGSPYQS